MRKMSTIEKRTNNTNEVDSKNLFYAIKTCHLHLQHSKNILHGPPNQYPLRHLNL